jgi:membrane peptidoglycan carboxypeptidase
VLAAEDRSFRSNPGFDITGIARATWRQLTGGSGGGSTITQQYIKVATGHDEYSMFRKFREVIVAAKITKQESKDRILEDYLNTIYFGRGAYGIEAASQAYFHKDVQNLTVSEAAVLAAVIRSPSRLDPAKNLAQAQTRWNFVLDGMVAQGWLSPADRSVGLYPETVPPSQAPGQPTDDRAHIIDRVMDELEKQGVSRAQLAVNGGKITTTIDPRAQQLARDAVQTELRGQPSNLHSSLVAIDPRSGAVIAYYGGSDGNGFDLAGGPAWNPGSAFKPFTMLAALERDIGMNSKYDGESPLIIDGRSYANSESKNYPQLTLHDAMTKSVNTAFVRLAQDVGPQAVRDAAIQRSARVGYHTRSVPGPHHRHGQRLRDLRRRRDAAGTLLRASIRQLPGLHRIPARRQTPTGLRPGRHRSQQPAGAQRHRHADRCRAQLADPVGRWSAGGCQDRHPAAWRKRR